MENNYSFINIIRSKYYHLIENIKIEWYEYSRSHNGKDVILEDGDVYYYANSNVRDEYWEIKIFTIEDIRLTIEKIESTPYRSPVLKKQTLENYQTILDTLKKYERQKKLTLILN